MNAMESSSTKSCRYCGKELPKEAIFCYYCRRELVTRPERPAAEKEKVGLKLWMVIGMAVILVGAVIVAVLMF